MTPPLFQSTPPVKAATRVFIKPFLRFQISIHAAREGGDEQALERFAAEGKFQSTPPVKAATFMQRLDLDRARISIHAAREGGDGVDSGRYRRDQDFNPRRP